MAIETDFDGLLDIVKSGSTFDALRAARQVAEIARERRKAEMERSIRIDMRDIASSRITDHEYIVLKNTLANIRAENEEPVGPLNDERGTSK